MLKPNFTIQDLTRHMNKSIDKIEKAIVMRLVRLGEECVNKARTERGYTDRTGNLVSSVGYVVVANGEIISKGFESSKGSTDGVEKGRKLAERLSADFPTGYALIVVAGMDYAYHVEAGGRNVLSTAENYAKQRLPELLKQLKQNINK
ncbi:MAG: hypothetical protein ACOYN4_15955 [Bacteroidales bacterium]